MLQGIIPTRFVNKLTHNIITFRLIAVGVLLAIFFAQDIFATSSNLSDKYYECRDKARDISDKEKAIKAGQFNNNTLNTALEVCVAAESMRWLGDYTAEKAYETAIRLAPEEPGYELLYGDYLRNFRGAGVPLFQRAEQHLLTAKAKAQRLPGSSDSKLGQLIQRALINLYQTDGLALYTSVEKFHEISDAVPLTLKRPALFFSTINEYADRTTDPDEVDDARNFTSEALFAESKLRLNQSLNQVELRRIARTKPQFDTLNRIRYRPIQRGLGGSLLSAFDVFMRYRNIEDAQISDFSDPVNFIDLDLFEFGISGENSFTLVPEWDAFLRGMYKRIRREGLIELQPDVEEDINHFEINGSLSHFFGPNKLTLTGVYVYQDIEPDISNPSNRDRQITSATASYLIATPATFESRFASRGLNLFGGFLFDRDSFGDVNIDKWDYFAGISLRGFGFDDAFDLTVQPTLLTSSVDNDKNQDNAQYRTNVTFLYRILDEERVEGFRNRILNNLYPAFLHLSIPFRHDVAFEGPDSYENWTIGADLSTKLFISSENFGPTFLASTGYKFQHFYKIDKDLNQFEVRLTMGF